MTIDPADRRPAARVDNQDAALFGQTPSQTVGPFFHYGLPWKGGADLIGASGMGARTDLFPPEHDVLNVAVRSGVPNGHVIELTGRVIDGAGAAVPDAMIEIWQADSNGRFAGEAGSDPHFVGFGRAATDDDGRYRFRTILPGRVAGPGGVPQARHVAMSVFARGLVRRVVTRFYFAATEGLADDPILAMVPAGRRDTLIARSTGEGIWSLDLMLQGAGETVFFDL
ncbi:protocatechuate 3,4-dioxygenase subunit alpha [Sphingomonas adhaesiva]|uniref:protocatechuate 3,4-dioxygenase subunit alpha n=1 Tax=Sphingomonas adhaesiva TaxID=28212 RepID=UPI002FF7FA0B